MGDVTINSKLVEKAINDAVLSDQAIRIIGTSDMSELSELATIIVAEVLELAEHYRYVTEGEFSDE